MSDVLILAGRYRLEDRVGSGGFGEVFRATDSVLRRTVAIKLLKTQANTLLSNPDLNEARAASALNHPNIVTVHDVAQDQGRPFIVMEWIEGNTLRIEIAKGPLPIPQVSSIGSQVASGLGRAHSVGIIHRDLKPENIMLRPDGMVKILDFGLAKRLSTDAESTKETLTGTLAGTVRYMSPEQVRGESTDSTSDLFTLGIILYEMVTGIHPFAAETPVGTMQRILHFNPEPPRVFTEVLPSWEELILKLLSKERSLRLQTAEEVSQFLFANRESQAIIPVQAKVERTLRAGHTVGRGRELAAIIERWGKANEGDGNVVMISGEPGIGKTTLVQLFTRSIQDEPSTLIASGRCSERLGVGEAYLPFLEAMTTLAGPPHGAIVRSIVKSKAPTWYLQLFPSFSTDSSVEQVRRELTGGSQERMRRELGDALEEIGQKFRTCVILEDLHWSDLATTELLAYLSKRIHGMRVLVVGTYRPSEVDAGHHPLKPILLEMTSRGASREIALAFLSSADVRSYTGLEFPNNRLTADFHDWVHRKTEGNPLFMADLLRYLVERQVMIDDQGWKLTKPLEALEGEAPASVRSMIERKMESLDEEDRRLLAIAAVQGDDFDSLVLAETAEIDELALEDQLEKLSRVHRLINPTGEVEFPDGSFTVQYKFVHVLYQNVLYAGLAAKRKSLLHLRIAENLERHHAPRLSQIASQLALHFERARQTERALPYYLQASDNVAAKVAYTQVEAYCNQALNLLSRLPAEKADRWRCDILSRRGRARFELGRFDESAEDFRETVASAERINHPAIQADALCELAQSLFWGKRNDELEVYVERAIALAERHQLPVAAARVRTLLGMQRFFYGKLDEGRNLLREAEEQAAALNCEPVRAVALGWRAISLYWQSQYEEALPLLEEGQRLGIENRDGFLFLALSMMRGLATANVGKIADAHRLIEEGLKVAEKNCDKFWLSRFPNCAGWLYHEVFDFEQAFRLNREGVAIGRQTGFLEPEANAEVNLGLSALEVGELEQAQAAFERADKIFRHDDWFRWRYRSRSEIGWADLFRRRGDLDSAFKHAAQGLEVAEQMKMRKHMALAHRVLGWLEFQRDQIAEAENHFQKALNLLQKMSCPLASWRVHMTVGDFYRALRRNDEATYHYGSALQQLHYVADHTPETMRTTLLNSKPLRDLKQAIGA